MKKLRGKVLMPLLMALVVPVLTVAGCGTVAAPTIPPIDTFVIPVEAFADNEPSSFVSLSEAGNQSNWNFAAVRVGFWRTVLRHRLAVPVAAFRASFRNIPLQQPDGSWVWSYSVRTGGSVYTAKLRGQFIAEGVRWEMRMSKEGEYEDFLWYWGESNLPATEGFWILKHSPADPTDLLRIDWSRNISAGTRAVRYTNIVADGPQNGSYIDTRHTDDMPYNHTWHIYNKGEERHIYIEWSSATGEGRVKALEHFGDDDWHCWDSSRINVVCP